MFTKNLVAATIAHTARMLFHGTGCDVYEAIMAQGFLLDNNTTNKLDNGW